MKKGNKKGFTLAEILGVVVIIGLLLILIAPVIVGRIGITKDTAINTNNRIIYNAASQHIIENRQNYPTGKKYCITVRELINEGKLASPVKDVTTGKTVDDNYSILVSIYSTGNEYYEGPFVDKVCEEVASIPMIDFIVDPAGTNWVQSRKVTIKYPSDTVERKYKKDTENFNNTGNQNHQVTFTKDGSITATAKYNGTKTESKINVVNIDSIEPTISQVGEPTCKKVVTVKLADEGGSKLKEYAVIKSEENLTNQKWKKLDKVNEKNIKFTAEDEVEYTIYVRDNAGNENSLKFKPNVRHNVVFNTNGGTPKPSDRSLINNKPYNQNGNLPNRDQISKTGYIFRGWYEDNNSFSKKIDDNTIMCVRTSDNTKNLYVKWEAKKVQVTFYRNTSASDTTNHTQTFTYGAASQSFSEKNWDNSKTGYSIVGWSENRNATTSNYSELSGVSNDWIESIYNSHNANKDDTNPKSHTLYLIWRANKYKIKFSNNGGSGSMNTITCTYDQDCKLPNNAFSKTGYSFNNWTAKIGGKNQTFTNGQTIKNLTSKDNEELTFYVSWKANEYTVSFDANGGSVSQSNKKVTYDSSYGTLPTPSRQGYRFVGWFKSDGTEVTSSTTYKTASNSTLYAHWKFIYTKPSCQLTADGTKGWNDWFRSDVKVKMTTSTGSGIPQSYGLSTSHSSKNGNKEVNVNTDTTGITYYGYVENEAGSSECSISFKRDVTKPLTTASNIHGLNGYTTIHSSTCNNFHSGTCYATYSASYMLYDLDYTCDDYGGSGCGHIDVKWLHDGTNQKLCPNWTDFDTCVNYSGFKTVSIPSYIIECFRTFDNAGNQSDEICVDMRRV